jgi:hypothetical protein
MEFFRLCIQLVKLLLLSAVKVKVNSLYLIKHRVGKAYGGGGTQSLFEKVSDCAHSLLLKSHYSHVMIGHGVIDWILLLFSIQS